MRLWKPAVEGVFTSMEDRLEANLRSAQQRSAGAGAGEGAGGTGEGSEEVGVYNALLEKYHRVQEAEDPRAKVAFMMTDAWSEKKLQETKAEMVQSLRRESETQRFWSAQADMP